MLAGPRSSGGPFALQIWTRHGETMTRTHASGGPGYSPALDAWLFADVDPRPTRRRHSAPAERQELTATPTRLRIATAEVGGTSWPTLVEAERERTQAAEAERQAARQTADAERARADTAERELERLERELQALRDKR